MAYICYKPAGACKTCEHYRYDTEEERMACFAQSDKDKAVRDMVRGMIQSYEQSKSGKRGSK